MTTDFWYAESGKFTLVDLANDKNLIRQKYIESLEALIAKLKEEAEYPIDTDSIESLPTHSLPTVFFTEFKQDPASDYAVIRVNCYRDRQEYIRHYEKES